MMEKTNHVNIAMIDDINTNGMAVSKVGTGVDGNKQRCGSTVSFHNIQYRVHQKSGFLCKRKILSKEILVDLNGIMRPGLNAILGPTGSGKSSFLDILAARKDPAGLSGEVLIDGAPQPPNFKCLSGYVVQEDVVMGTLTVRENLRFSAALRLHISVPQSEKEARVNHLIKELGLTKVNWAAPSIQISALPTHVDILLYCVFVCFFRMTSRGRTIIMSIHQPRYSIYRLFDTLTLLVGGKMVYHGPAPNALDYFANIGYPCEPHNNPADFFLDVINGDFTGGMQQNLDFEELSSSRQSIEERLVDEYRNSNYCSDTQAELERIVKDKRCESPPKSRTITYNSSFLHQLRWVLQRTFQNLMLNPQTSVAQLGVNVFLALIVGAIFFGVKDDQSGIQNRHEYISGYYRVSVYFLSKILSDIALRTVTSVIFSCVVYFLIGLKSTAEAFFVFMLTVTLVAYTATAMTMAISADQSVVALANILMTITFVFMMVRDIIFSGLLVNLPSIKDWLAWLKYFSIPRYGLAVSRYSRFSQQNMHIYCSTSPVIFAQALKINEFVGLRFCEEAVIQNTNVSAMMANCTVNTAGLT
uniref:ABC-type xenobiotic transporter n=1 Tax=Amphilophus citrinellus TaxID=61819 RepID=A0A3Q0SUG1_AMPCI